MYPHSPALLPLSAVPLQVFLDFARHQLEEGNHDTDGERAAAAMKHRALMRQHSIQIGDSSRPGSRAGIPPHQPMANDGNDYHSVIVWN